MHRAPQLAQSCGGRAAAKGIDEDRRVEQQRQRSADTGRVAAPLRRHPSGRIAIPLVLARREGTETGFDVLPAALVIECAAKRLADEHAAPALAHAPIELLHQVVVKAYVQSHGHTLAHIFWARPAITRVASGPAR